MEIIKENIKIFITSQGLIAIGELVAYEENNKIKLKCPFRIIPTNEGIQVGAIFLKEEWCKIDLASSIEVNVPASLLDVYEKYVNQVHSSIIIPTQQEKQIILN